MNKKEIDERLLHIFTKTKVIPRVRPLNLKNEKIKFFKNKNYNPQFKYKSAYNNYSEYEKQLVNMKIDKSAIGILFENRRDDLLKKINLIKSIGKSSFVNESIKYYGFPNNKIVGLAKKKIKKVKKYRDKDDNIHFEDTRKIIKKYLKDYSILDFKILRREIVSDCLYGNNTLYISLDAKFTKNRLRKTIAHEIETHLLRYKNGLLQPYKIFSYYTADSFKIEEGLAIVNQSKVSGRKIEKDFWAAANILAVNKAYDSSFREVYKYIKSLGFDKESSWTFSVKAKRGLLNTEKPGCFTKDHVYFSGEQRVKKYLKKGGKLKDLYIGKVGINDLKIIDNIKGIKKPKYLPKFYKKDE